MIKSAEIAEGTEVCPRCGLPVESESDKRCACAFAQPREQNAPEAADLDEWSDVT